MDNSGITTADLESFVNDYLKEDLKQLEKLINYHNEEMVELIQLKNTLQTMQEYITNKFKTQMNLGGNIFLEAEVDCKQNILVDVGKSCFVEFTFDEAIKFINFKVAILTKQCQVIRDESINKRSDIKLALMYMSEKSDANIQ